MHTFNDSASGVPAFLAKLWRLVEDPETNHLIYWQSDGTSFIIQNQAQFARELLPQNYKHNNMASFIRQLNMYGFHKIASIDNGGLKFDKDEMEFSHSCFQRDNPYLLEHIKRKIATTKQPPEEKSTIKAETVNKVIHEVKAVRGRQETLDTRFSEIKQENEALWREIAVLRQKHMKQQQIVNKLIQFLVTIVQPSRNGSGMSTMTGLKRRFQLMIDDVPESSKKRKKSQDSGPVIHELTEDLLDDCNYDCDVPIDSPTIVSPATFSTSHDDDVDEDVSSPTHFSVEKVTDVDTADSQFYDPNEKVSYVIKKVPENHEWVDANNAAKQPQTIKKEPIQEYLISYAKPVSKDKLKVNTKTVATPVTSKSQGTSLLNRQLESNKKRPQLLLKMNKPAIRNDAKMIQSIAPGKVVTASKPTTSTSVIANDQIKKEIVAATNAYKNQNDFVGSDMPNDLFESQTDTGASPLLSSDTNLASGSYNSSLSEDSTKKLSPTSSKNLALAKYKNGRQDCDMQLNTPEDVAKEIDYIQNDLDCFNNLLQTDTDYTLDANALFGNPPGTSAKNRLLLSPSVDSELFSKIFGDLDAPFGLSLNSDFPMEKREDASGSEVATYQPYNSFDMSGMMDPDSALACIGEQHDENAADEDSLLNAPELNTPRIDRNKISFTK